MAIMAVMDMQLFAELAVMLAIVAFGVVGWFFSSHLAQQKAVGRQLCKTTYAAEDSEYDLSACDGTHGECCPDDAAHVAPEAQKPELLIERPRWALIEKSDDDIIFGVRGAIRTQQIATTAVGNIDPIAQAVPSRTELKMQDAMERRLSDLVCKSDDDIIADVRLAMRTQRGRPSALGALAPVAFVQTDTLEQKTQNVWEKRLANLVCKSDDDLMMDMRRSLQAHRQRFGVDSRLDSLKSEPVGAKTTSTPSEMNDHVDETKPCPADKTQACASKTLLMEDRLSELVSKSDDDFIGGMRSAFRTRHAQPCTAESPRERQLQDLMTKTDDDLIMDVRRALRVNRTHARRACCV